MLAVSRFRRSALIIHRSSFLALPRIDFPCEEARLTVSPGEEAPGFGAGGLPPKENQMNIKKILFLSLLLAASVALASQRVMVCEEFTTVSG